LERVKGTDQQTIAVAALAAARIGGVRLCSLQDHPTSALGRLLAHLMHATMSALAPL